MTPKEQQSILTYKSAKPTEQDKFFVKYESVDDFQNNESTVIKKLQEGNQFCWTAFSKSENPQEDENEEEQSKEPYNSKKDEVTVADEIRITKTITFTDDTKGAEILNNLLIKLDI